MSTRCPQCGVALSADTRFCTNCGAVLSGSYSQQATPSSPSGGFASQGPSYQAQQQAQVPSWASANPGAYPQPPSSWGGQGASPMNSLGFSSQNAALNNNAPLKKAIGVVVGVIIGAVVLLILFAILAATIPGLRCLFLLLIFLMILIPWLIYRSIRRSLRRTLGAVGPIGWFF